ncbi:hypothetical protein NWE57_00885 [Mycoplasmopsis cynos]|nr:hypothetical protein [Mycoplasmopsis cynos]UWV92659.1 hypothetical protein NWE57_00885 [Mycoplasmopsis cynos]
MVYSEIFSIKVWLFPFVARTIPGWLICTSTISKSFLTSTTFLPLMFLGIGVIFEALNCFIFPLDDKIFTISLASTNVYPATLSFNDK